MQLMFLNSIHFFSKNMSLVADIEATDLKPDPNVEYLMGIVSIFLNFCKPTISWKMQV